MTIIRAKAPLRLGLAGGGTDVSPYADLHGGCILNATINLYAYASFEPQSGSMLRIINGDQELSFDTSHGELCLNGEQDLIKQVCNRLLSKYSGPRPFGGTITTYVDVPSGSGLGGSSTLVVAVIGALSEYLKLPLGEYDIAHLAYEVERVDLAMMGGRQDQYAATFGGFNFMEFYADDRVIVNPLRIRADIINELEYNLLLYYTGTSRASHKIIETQVQQIKNNDQHSLESTHGLKIQAQRMKEALLRGKTREFGELLDYGWQHKKKLAADITNPLIEEMYQVAKQAGVIGGKLSGAGGGGFMTYYCDNGMKSKVARALEKFGGRVIPFHFTKHGLQSWTVS